MAIPADSFARAVSFAISQPEEVDVKEILFRRSKIFPNHLEMQFISLPKSLKPIIGKGFQLLVTNHSSLNRIDF